MKTLLMIAGLLLFVTGAFAQNQVYLVNRTSCDLHLQMHASDPANNCVNSSSIGYVVPSGQTIPAQAPNSTEWVYTEVVPSPWGGGCSFGQAIDTDGYPGCLNCPGYGAPSFATMFTGGCNGCNTFIHVMWQANCGGNASYIYLYY